MELCDVTAQGQLEEYYREKDLDSTDKKIARLMATMKVKAVQCEHGPAPENVLACLEGCAMVGSWKGYL
jgi:hypothetical protein